MPRITAELNDGVAPEQRVNHKRVARVMRAHAIAGLRLRRRVRTTIPEPAEQQVVGAENPVTSCDLHVLVDEAAEPVSSERRTVAPEGGGVPPRAGADRVIGAGGAC